MHSCSFQTSGQTFCEYLSCFYKTDMCGWRLRTCAMWCWQLSVFRCLPCCAAAKSSRNRCISCSGFEILFLTAAHILVAPATFKNCSYSDVCAVVACDQLVWCAVQFQHGAAKLPVHTRVAGAPVQRCASRCWWTRLAGSTELRGVLRGGNKCDWDGNGDGKTSSPTSTASAQWCSGSLALHDYLLQMRVTACTV